MKTSASFFDMTMMHEVEAKVLMAGRLLKEE